MKSYQVEIGVTEADREGWVMRTDFYPYELPIIIKLLAKAEEWIAINKVPPM